jgi:hypothetical protein
VPLRELDGDAFGAVQEHQFAGQVVLISSRFATADKPFENQQISERTCRTVAAIIGTKGHQSARSGTQSPEKVPNYVLEAFTRVAATANDPGCVPGPALATEAAALSSAEAIRQR